MTATRYKPWMCSDCGYLMDAASPVRRSDAVPKSGDLSICLNCGNVYTLADGRWRPLTSAEFDALQPDERRKVIEAQLVRAGAGIPDLARRGGHA